MSDPTNPTPPAPPAAAPTQTTTAPVPGAPINVHVHTAPQTPSAAPSAPAPQAPAATAPQAPAATAPAADAKPAAVPYVNPWANRAPKVAAPAAQPSTSAPIAAAPTAPMTPAAPAQDPEVVALRARVDAMTSVMATQASDAINSLPENAKAYVLARAGDDPAAQLNEIRTLRSHGFLTPPPQVVTAGANTLPAPAPSAPPAPLSPDASALAQYEALKAKGSNFAANAFMRLNAQAIQRARASRAS